MDVSSGNTYSASHISNTQRNPQDLTQDERDSVRQATVAKAGKESQEAQIEAYVAGTKQANETTQNESNEDYVQDYTEFASDLRRAENYASLVENGVDASSITDRPSTLPVQDPSQLDQEQRDSVREAAVAQAGQESKEAQLEAYKAGTEQAASSAILDETAQYVENYNEFAADVRRSEYLNTYVENNNYLAG